MLAKDYMANTTIVRATSGARSQVARRLYDEVLVLEQEAWWFARTSFFVWAWPRMSLELRAFVVKKLGIKEKWNRPSWVELVQAVKRECVESTRLELRQRCYKCGLRGHSIERCWGVLQRVGGSNGRCVGPVKRELSVNEEVVVQGGSAGGRKEDVLVNSDGEPKDGAGCTNVTVRGESCSEEMKDLGVESSRKRFEDNNGKVGRASVVDTGNGMKKSDEERLRVLKRRYPNVLGESVGKIKWCVLEKCKIRTVEGMKVVKKGQIVPQALKGKTEEYLKDLERRGVIKRSQSEWRNPIRAIQKPNGDVRVVSNLIALNDLVEKDPYELVNIRDVIRETQGSRWFTVLDLREAFYHVEIEECDKKKTAFEFNGTVYEWNSMVMGFKNSPQILQRIMNTLLGDLRGKGVEAYMDDIVVHARSMERHDELLEEVLKRLSENNLRVNIDKVQFCRESVKLLGVTIDGIEQTPSEIKKHEALEYPVPTKVKELRRFLGLTGWFRNFIKDYARLTVNLTGALKGSTKGRDIDWTEEMQKEFIELKRQISGMKSLLLPSYNKEFMLRTDASNTGLGAVLLQRDSEGRWRPVQWASKKLTPTEGRYTISEKEMLAVYWGIEKFSYELKGRKFRLVTDHKALEEIRNKPYFNNDRINRWVEKIQGYDFTVEYNKGEELAAPDALSRLHEEDAVKRSDEMKRSEETQRKGYKIKKGKWSKHAVVDGELTKWVHDDGRTVEVPKECERKEIIEKIHEEVQHRGIESVYYRLKDRWYWPGVKKDIAMVIRGCDVCEVNNRKKMGGNEFVVTTRYLEKVALDMVDVRNEGKYVLVAIDYFTRIAMAKVLESKETDLVVRTVEEWMAGGARPEELITDNGKEFTSVKFRVMCYNAEVKLTTVSVESHRSNGRVERLIGTLRESLAKNKEGKLVDRVKKFIDVYNSTYHSGIRCTPLEALSDETGLVMLENGPDGAYARRFIKRKREKFVRGQVVRMASRENIKGDVKNIKGRFVHEGVILDVLEGDSYLVKRLGDDRIVKKRHYDLKGVITVSD